VESQEKLRKLDPNMRLVQPYLAKGRAVSPPVMVNGELVFAERLRLVSLRSNGKTVKWMIHKETPIIDYLVNGVVILLTKGYVEQYDSEDGEKIGSFRVTENTEKLLGNYQNLALIERIRNPKTGKIGLPVLKRVDTLGHIVSEYEGSAESSFAFTDGQFYEKSREKDGWKIRSLSGEKSVLSGLIEGAKPGSELILRSFADKLYLSVKGSGIHILDRNSLEKIGFIKTESDYAAFWNRDGKSSLILHEAGVFRILSDSGELQNEIKIKVASFSDQSFTGADAESLVYVGSDRKIRRITIKGLESWSVEIPKTQENEMGNLLSAYTLYY
jgi:hypothetical protein